MSVQVLTQDEVKALMLSSCQILARMEPSASYAKRISSRGKDVVIHTTLKTSHLG